MEISIHSLQAMARTEVTSRNAQAKTSAIAVSDRIGGDVCAHPGDEVLSISIRIAFFFYY